MAQLDLGESDGGRSYPVAAGDLVVVRLPETPSSGYRWQVDTVDADVLAPAGDTFRPERPGLGGEGMRLLRFTVVGAGHASLRLALRRGWEKGEPAVRRYDVSIHVTG